MTKATEVFLRIIGVILLVWSVFVLFESMEKDRKETAEVQAMAQAALEEMREGYDRIKVGMTYDECVSLLGAEGECSMENESEYGKSAVYGWKADEDDMFSTIVIVFEDDLVSEKTWSD